MLAYTTCCKNNLVCVIERYMDSQSFIQKPLHPDMFCITLSYLRMTFCCILIHYPSQQGLVGTTPHIKHVNISSGK